MIWLVGFPIPPSVNDWLRPVTAGMGINKAGKPFQKARFIKSDTHREFAKRCQEWRAYHNISFTKVQDHLLGLQHIHRVRHERFALRVDTFFAFRDSRLWTVNNLAEPIDADNRIKPCRDALAAMLGIDDKYFRSGFFELVSAPSKETEGTFIRITPMTPRTHEDVMKQIQLEAGNVSTFS